MKKQNYDSLMDQSLIYREKIEKGENLLPILLERDELLGLLSGEFDIPKELKKKKKQEILEIILGGDKYLKPRIGKFKRYDSNPYITCVAWEIPKELKKIAEITLAMDEFILDLKMENTLKMEIILDQIIQLTPELKRFHHIIMEGAFFFHNDELHFDIGY